MLKPNLNTQKTYINIDEFSSSFKHSKENLERLAILKDNNINEYYRIRENLFFNFVQDVLEKTKLLLFGTLEAHTNVQGYNQTFNLCNADFAIFSYHTNKADNGFFFRISAHSLYYYLKNYESQTGERIEVHHFIKTLFDVAKTHNLIPRLTRIDIAADFLNYDTSVHQLNLDYNSKKIVVKNRQTGKYGEILYRGNRLSKTAYENESAVNTIYLGQKDSKTGFLRIYNKKLEQETNKDALYKNDANQCKTWIRFEAVFKGEYSTQIGEALYQISDNQDYLSSLASFINQRYTFFNKEHNNELSLSLFSEILYELEFSNSSNEIDILSKNYRHNDLEKIKERLKLPAFANTFYILLKTLGEDNLDSLYADLKAFLEKDFQPSREVDKTINIIKSNLFLSNDSD